MELYWTGYVITFLILYNCRRPVNTPTMKYLDKMGITAPFTCTNKGLLSSLLQALIWPWPFFIIALILALSPFLLIYAYFKR